MFGITCALKSLRSWPFEHFTGWIFAVLRAFNPIHSTASLAKRSHYANMHAVESNLKSPFSFPMNFNSEWFSICEHTYGDVCKLNATLIALCVNKNSWFAKLMLSMAWWIPCAKTIWCIINFASNTFKRLLKLFLSLTSSAAELCPKGVVNWKKLEIQWRARR